MLSTPQEILNRLFEILAKRHVIPSSYNCQKSLIELKLSNI